MPQTSEYSRWWGADGCTPTSGYETTVTGRGFGRTSVVYGTRVNLDLVKSRVLAPTETKELDGVSKTCYNCSSISLRTNLGVMQHLSSGLEYWRSRGAVVQVSVEHGKYRLTTISVPLHAKSYSVPLLTTQNDLRTHIATTYLR